MANEPTVRPAVPRPPRRALGRRVVGLLVLAGIGLLLGIASLAVGGSERGFLLVGLLLCALGTALVASAKAVGPPGDHMVGGAGYIVPRSRAERLLHTTITLLYNIGIMVVVFAALVRFGALQLGFAQPILDGFPIALAVYLALLAIAAGRRILLQGGVLRTWYTRVHGLVLATLSIPIAAAALALAWRGTIERNGTVWLTESDVLVLLLVGLLGVGTQLFLAANLPTIFDLTSGLMRAMTTKRTTATRDTPPIVYALLLAMLATIVVGYLLVRFDVVGQLGNFQNRRVALLLVLFPVGAAFFFLSAALQIWRESRRGLYKKRIPTKLRNDLFVYGFSTLAGLGMSILLVMNLVGRLDALGPVSGQSLQMDLIVLAVLTTAGPIGWYMHRQNRRVDGIEARLPDFLNDLAETRRAGLTLTASLQSCALSDYGPLTPEIRKMAVQVGWGLAFTEALQQFADRVKTSLVRRSASLIIEASRTGGSVSEILKAAAKDAYEIKALEQDRRVAMMTYLIVIYVVFFVFMTVLIVLDVQFIPKVLEASAAAASSSVAAGGAGFGNTKGINAADIHFAYFLGGIVQAVGNGIVGGVLSEGRVTAGLRHTAIMASTIWIMFRFALGT